MLPKANLSNMTTVWDFFMSEMQYLHIDPRIEPAAAVQFSQLSINSSCGNACRRVIEATAVYLALLVDVNDRHRTDVWEAAGFQCLVLMNG